jgi:hypothetical protein
MSSNPLAVTKRSHSPAINALMQSGRKSQRVKRLSSFLTEMESCERRFYAQTQLDRNGNRTNKPRIRIGDPDSCFSDLATMSAEKTAWLREHNRGLS